MPHARTYEAIILRTHDINEADRFCIVFTREGGRKAARAKGVRKPMSRMGGVLMPFRLISLQLIESGSSALIVSAVDKGSQGEGAADYASFVRLQQGAELLINLTEDDEPLPEVFDLFAQFIPLCIAGNEGALLAFQLRLLHLLGLLPSTLDDTRFTNLSAEGRAYIEACMHVKDLTLLTQLFPGTDEIKRFATYVVGAQLQRPLKSEGMIF